jgi:hypothetical protein
MDHKLATDSMAAERYLLGELNSDERKDFETHAFECDECGTAISDGIAFLDNGREVVAGERRFRWRPAVTTWLPSAVAAALAIVVGVQNFGPAVQQQVPLLEVLNPYPLEQSRAAEKHVRAGQPAVLYVNITDQSQPSYVCDLRDASQHVHFTLPITKEQAQEVVPVALLRPLPAGSYELVVYGVRADGNRGPKVASYPFEVDR